MHVVSNTRIFTCTAICTWILFLEFSLLLILATAFECPHTTAVCYTTIPPLDGMQRRPFVHHETHVPKSTTLPIYNKLLSIRIPDTILISFSAIFFLHQLSITFTENKKVSPMACSSSARPSTYFPHFPCVMCFSQVPWVTLLLVFCSQSSGTVRVRDLL